MRSSERAKSSRCRFSTTLPCASRTTTLTSTRLTRTLNVAGVSRVSTSAAFVSCGGGGAGVAGCAGAFCADTGSAQNMATQKREVINLVRLYTSVCRANLLSAKEAQPRFNFGLHRDAPQVGRRPSCSSQLTYFVRQNIRLRLLRFNHRLGEPGLPQFPHSRRHRGT